MVSLRDTKSERHKCKCAEIGSVLENHVQLPSYYHQKVNTSQNPYTKNDTKLTNNNDRIRKNTHIKGNDNE